ncbi:hypothetical protein K443DRAFT_680123 [Laccaria amethystina LaAM-08-1]|uniref:Uncharacterized protein n=1 Tax=Laccaria amethystina LaAM-08-1 TaxID=1095629 RepID=A0A0C9WNK4_9AGAR|nr:hypothetical protein K443DRAFT_680123 [Laccaria amethystina LaAM-08-1]
MARMVRISDDYDGRKTKRRTATPVAVRHCHLFLTWQPNDDDGPSSLLTNGDEDPPSPITCMQRRPFTTPHQRRR